MESITVQSIAKAFLHMESMPEKKLQKLCYYAYSWFLTLFHRKLYINDFEAWIHGPTSVILHRDYEQYAWRNIPNEQIPEEVTKEIYDFLKEIYRAYGHLSSDNIEDLTHYDDPVILARKDVPDYEPSNNKINDDHIIHYYRKVFHYYNG